MKYGLTKQQGRCLEFLKTYIKKEGLPPTNEEIIGALGLSARSGAVRLLRGLEKRGHILRIKHKTRSIALIPDPDEELDSLRELKASVVGFLTVQQKWRDEITAHGSETTQNSETAKEVGRAFKRLGKLVR
tara:strand:+ start:2041 stop:2433 length:393 start_codon:yes stop_codon:yes gene_type:complete